MPTTEPILSEEDVVLAGELALGVLDGDDLIAARRRLIAEPAFAREVARWRDHFAVLALDGPDVVPPDSVEARIREALRAEQSGGLQALPRSPRVMRWQSWAMGLGGVGLGAAAALALALLRPGIAPPVPAGPIMVAALDVPAAHATVLARMDAGRLRLTGLLDIPDRRDAQAWVIDGAAPPRSLGVLRRRGDRVLETIPHRALAPGQTLAISIEPVGGAPGPLPTGPVVATGKIEEI